MVSDSNGFRVEEFDCKRIAMNATKNYVINEMQLMKMKGHFREIILGLMHLLLLLLITNVFFFYKKNK